MLTERATLNRKERWLALKVLKENIWRLVVELQLFHYGKVRYETRDVQ